jgi:hypothetical protein
MSRKRLTPRETLMPLAAAVSAMSHTVTCARCGRECIGVLMSPEVKSTTLCPDCRKASQSAEAV